MAQPHAPGEPPVDVLAILAALQDQLDDLTAAVRAQQDAIDALTRAVRSRDA
jgi:hypothetical protein